MILHIVGIVALTMLILVCTFLPYIPGGYDGLAVTLSTMSQIFGVTGLLLVPIGSLWLVYEVRKRAAKNTERSKTDKGFYFAIASLITSSFVTLTVSFGAFVTLGVSLMVIVLALWVYCVSRMVRRLKLLKNAHIRNFNATPLYLLLVPTVVALFQFTLLDGATEFSRNHAIKSSAELINGIETYHKAHGLYPTSLLALFKDYKPAVIGIEEFHYEPNGNSYNLYFEQLSNRFGTQEIVMYNKLDEHLLPAHNKDILEWTREQLYARPGYYAVHDASSPHWKYFWFD